MNYEEEARSLFRIERQSELSWWVLLMLTPEGELLDEYNDEQSSKAAVDEWVPLYAAWLRQHDARLLREEASGYTEGNGPYCWWEIRDNLERRAREIEAEIGEPK